MTDHNAKRLANRYGMTAGQWCRTYYAAQLVIDWRDLLTFVRILRSA